MEKLPMLSISNSSINSSVSVQLVNLPLYLEYADYEKGNNIDDLPTES